MGRFFPVRLSRTLSSMAARTTAPLPSQLQDALLSALDAEAESRASFRPQRSIRSKYILDHARQALDLWRIGEVTTREAVEALHEAVQPGSEGKS
jgi:hypothetical protein